MDKKIQKFQKIQKSGQRVAAAPLLLSSTSPRALGAGGAGAEQGRRGGAGALGRRRPWSRGGARALGRKSVTREGGSL